MYFLGRAIHEFMIPMKYLFTSKVILKIIGIPLIQVSTNIIFNPQNFMPINDLRVFWTYHALDILLFLQCLIAIWLTTCFVLFTHLPSFIFFLCILLFTSFTKRRHMKRHLPWICYSFKIILHYCGSLINFKTTAKAYKAVCLPCGFYQCNNRPTVHSKFS